MLKKELASHRLKLRIKNVTTVNVTKLFHHFCNWLKSYFQFLVTYLKLVICGINLIITLRLQITDISQHTPYQDFSVTGYM
jgi:5'(3')-deoxyribonucleotidase